MAEKIVSPGVFTKEIDQSFLPAAIGEIGAAIVGPTVKGPYLTPTVISNMSEYEEKFGTTFKSGSSYYSYLTSETARQYFRNGSPLTVVRILAGSPSVASATIYKSIDPDIAGVDSGSHAKYEFKLNEPETSPLIFSKLKSTTSIGSRLKTSIVLKPKAWPKR